MRIAPTDTAMRGAVAIPLDVALARFPTLATTCAAPDRSARYTQIATADVLRGLDAEGFEIFSIQTQRCLDQAKRAYAKHLVRLRKRGARQFAGSVPEICVLNSHNGRSAYHNFAGVLKFACENGLFVGDILGRFKVRHTGDIVGDVIDASYQIVAQFDKLESHVGAMQSRVLSYDERLELAARSLDVRYPDGPTPFHAADLLHARRMDDTGADLWTVFNRVQENVTRGGLRGFAPGSNGRIRRSTMRGISGLDSDLRINRALWDVAASYLPASESPLLIAAE